MKNIGKDDPRRIIHSLKVATGLTAVSTFYYINPIFKDLGSSVMWAVLTVALVMEFFVGAAVLKGLNRACATYLMETLGVYTGSNNAELPKHLGEGCVELSSKCSKALTEAASAMCTVTAHSAAAKCYMDAANSAAMQLRTSFSENCIVSKETLCAAPIVSLSMEIVRCVGEIVASVEELVQLVRFASSNEVVLKGNGRTTNDAETADVFITIEE